jgi:hypothetical protein
MRRLPLFILLSCLLSSVSWLHADEEGPSTPESVEADPGDANGEQGNVGDGNSGEEPGGSGSDEGDSGEEPGHADNPGEPGEEPGDRDGDFDSDGIKDGVDGDDDNDGIPDAQDAYLRLSDEPPDALWSGFSRQGERLDGWMGSLWEIDSDLSYHRDFGYIFHKWKHSDSVWLYLFSSQMGWTWTGRSLYPLMYTGREGWVSHISGSPWMFAYGKQTWLKVGN